MIAAAVVTAACAGCGGSTGIGSVLGGGGGVAQCTVALISGTLLSPANGATGVPGSVGTISFSVSNAGMLAGSLLLTPSGGGAPITGGPITGTAANASAAVPALAAHTTYVATLSANLPGDPCNPRGSLLGSFTTI